MKYPLRTYVLYLSLGINLAVLGGFLYTSSARTPTPGMDSSTHHPVEQKSESDEWHAFKGQLRKLESKTRPLKRSIARKQRELLKRIMNRETDGDTRDIRQTHNSIHELQRKLQDRTLVILLEEHRKLSGPERRRVFGRLLNRHRHRYRSLYSDDEELEEDEDHREETEEDDEDD